MKTSFKVLIFTAIVGAIFLVHTFLNKPIINPEKVSSNSPKTVSKNQTIKPQRISSANNFEDDSNPLFDADLLNTILLQASNDYVLSVEDADYFNQSSFDAEGNGFEIIEKINELDVFRIKIKNPLSFAKFLDDSENDFELQNNAKLTIPSFPDSRLLEKEEPFSGTSMQWLGANGDRWSSGEGIKVAILDTGIDPNHPALDGVVFSELSLIDEGRSHENKGHGTGIASIIAGQGEEFLGLAPASEILSLQVLDENGEGDSFTIAKGIISAVDQGADIINLSLGGATASSVMEKAIQYAKSKDVIMIASVGNDGDLGVAYPARHQDVVAVSSVDKKSRVSAFANFGPEVDISAPGVGIFTAWEDNEIVSFSGTSIATAFVTAALSSELSKSSFFSKDQAVKVLYENADETEKPGKDIWAGRGVLNIRRLEQREDPNVVDAAIVGYYFDSKNLQYSGTTPFYVTVQNQGTSWIQSMNLKVRYKGLVKDFRIGNLEKGQIKSETLYFDSGIKDKKLSISSELNLNNQTDNYPANNFRKSTLVLP